MSSVLEKKQQTVKEIKEKIQAAKSIVFVDYNGMNVQQDTALRKACRAVGVEYKVYKNRLVEKAVNELKISGFENKFGGDTGIAFGNTDEVVAPKTITEVILKNDKLHIKFGMLGKAYMDDKQIKSLAALPSKEILIAQLLGMLNAPVSSLARTLNAIVEKN